MNIENDICITTAVFQVTCPNISHLKHRALLNTKMQSFALLWFIKV